MNIKSFKGRKYDQDKIDKYNIRVERKIEEIEDINSRVTTKRENGFCTFCGAIRPSGEVGIGCGCKNIVDKFFKGYLYNKEFVEIPKEFSENYFTAYKKYVKYIRALYLYSNTKNHDMKTLKSFRSSFKKSFSRSMLNNKECIISKKQLVVMENDNNTYDKWYREIEYYKNYVFNKFYYDKGFNDFSRKVYNSIEFGLYCRIQVAHAWVK